MQPETRIVKQVLPVDLDDADVAERASRLCLALTQAEQEREDFAGVRSAFKLRLSALEEEAHRLRAEIESRVGSKELEVLEVLDFDAGVARFFPLGTTNFDVEGALLGTRMIRDDERQAELVEGLNHPATGDPAGGEEPDANEGLADEAYEAGAAAAEAGLALSDNPYNKFDEAYLHNTWRNGYVENAQEATEG